MTNEQINRAVAEELIGTLCWMYQTEDEYVHREDCPCNGTGLIELDFCNDHNAAAEMRRVIKTKDERATFVVQLLRLLISEDPQNGYEDYAWVAMNATPRQQAEAFLRLRGKWREG